MSVHDLTRPVPAVPVVPVVPVLPVAPLVTVVPVQRGRARLAGPAGSAPAAVHHGSPDHGCTWSHALATRATTAATRKERRHEERATAQASLSRVRATVVTAVLGATMLAAGGWLPLPLG